MRITNSSGRQKYVVMLFAKCAKGTSAYFRARTWAFVRSSELEHPSNQRLCYSNETTNQETLACTMGPDCDTRFDIIVFAHGPCTAHGDVDTKIAHRQPDGRMGDVRYNRQGTGDA